MTIDRSKKTDSSFNKSQKKNIFLTFWNFIFQIFDHVFILRNEKVNKKCLSPKWLLSDSLECVFTLFSTIYFVSFHSIFGFSWPKSRMTHSEKTIEKSKVEIRVDILSRCRCHLKAMAQDQKFNANANINFRLKNTKRTEKWGEKMKTHATNGRGNMSMSST